MDEVIRILARSPYFRGVPSEILSVIATCGEHVQVAAGEELAREGSDPTMAWVLGRGTVEVRRFHGLREGAPHLVAVLQPGAFFGHLAFLSASDRSSDLVATTSAELVRFSAADFKRLVGDPDYAGPFFRRAAVLSLGDALIESVTHLREVMAARR